MNRTNIAARSRVVFGAALWISSLQFFVTNWVVAARWADPAYDPIAQAISSLGSTECAPRYATFVCSPWHAAANISWTIAGACILLGTVLTAPALPRDRLGRGSTWLRGGAGAGLMIVGLFPDDVALAPHVLGALLLLVGGNVGLVLLGVALRRNNQWPRLGSIAVIVGILGVVTAPLMPATDHLGVSGLFERISGYPMIASFAVLGYLMIRGAPSR